MTLGMVISALGVVWLGSMGTDTGYAGIAGAIVVMAAGMALVFPAATESIVTALPENKAGVASAMNDTTREVGGAIGIALLGSLLSSGYHLSQPGWLRIYRCTQNPQPPCHLNSCLLPGRNIPVYP